MIYIEGNYIYDGLEEDKWLDPDDAANPALSESINQYSGKHQTLNTEH